MHIPFNQTQISKTKFCFLENAVLIVGGHNIEQPVTHSEVFFPRTGKGCIVPEYEFPGGAYGNDATMNTFGDKTLLCGGWDHSSECYEFTPSNATVWTKYADLNHKRNKQTTWESSQGLVLMGGKYSPKTAELVGGGTMNFSLPATK